MRHSQVFGSGYVWLVAEVSGASSRPKLTLYTTANQDVPPANQVPLLVLDLVRNPCVRVFMTPCLSV